MIVGKEVIDALMDEGRDTAIRIIEQKTIEVDRLHVTILLNTTVDTRIWRVCDPYNSHEQVGRIIFLLFPWICSSITNISTTPAYDPQSMSLQNSPAYDPQSPKICIHRLMSLNQCIAITIIT